MILYSKSHVGYSHVEASRPCQDYSSKLEDGRHAIIAVADGHGGEVYIRSERGSRFACEAVEEVFSLYNDPKEIFPNKVKLQILCAWNARVEKDYGKDPFTEEELSRIDEDLRDELAHRPERAYGTTLLGAAKIGDSFLVVHIGDGESLIYKDGKVSPCFEDDDEEPVANVTYSMCGEDVLSHMRLTLIPCEFADFVLLCTDGTANPYQSYKNLCASLVLPVVRELSSPDGAEKVDAFLHLLASKTGTGDDVSLAALGLGPVEVKKEEDLAEEEPSPEPETAEVEEAVASEKQDEVEEDWPEFEKPQGEDPIA